MSEIVPALLRAFPVALLLWCLAISVRAWRGGKNGEEHHG
jgi:hypothetical protein